MGGMGPFASLAFYLSSRNFVHWYLVSLGQSLLEKSIAAVMTIDGPVYGVYARVLLKGLVGLEHRWASIWGVRSCVIERLSRVGAGWEAPMAYRITLNVSMRFIVLRLMILALGVGLVILGFVNHFGHRENNSMKALLAELTMHQPFPTI
jgi:hypothetical protein